jgi:putative sugar O-methyltransferase
MSVESQKQEITSIAHGREKYLNVCMNAASSDSAFATFKRHVDYTPILEHVSKEQGQDYLNVIKEYKIDITPYLFNDKYGGTIKHKYQVANTELEVSPTTLRYIKVAGEISKLFNDVKIETVTEIGCGYGGQSLILSKMISTIKHYNLIDLPEVNKLIDRYISVHDFKIGKTVNALDSKALTVLPACDLLISNYAFTECTPNVRQIYLDTVIKSAKNGYITINFITEEERKYLYQSLIKMGKSIKLINEVPLTSTTNIILTWTS